MSTQKIRQKFLNYFRDNGHSVIASSPVIPHDDPTLLFNNAGMNQFKDVFLGESVREYKRATTSQKCIRAGGKHNDLENVGHTKRHLTFFEMLGNFSFGDYFKEDAIRFAWEVSTNVFEFDPSKIWATVFREDDEAFELWTKYLPVERIQRLNEDTNFWAMGDTGPCGPCSELLFDLGDGYGSAKSPLYDTSGERYLEYWNLVFMQFNKKEDGVSYPLPKPSIDTGAGLERVVELSTHVGSVFETDILRNIIAGVENLIGKQYNPKDSTAPCFQVIADHLRSLSFAIADGAQPSNVDRGYVLRKILRRAVRYGRTLGFETPFLAKVLPRLIDTMGEDYPGLVQSQDRIGEILTHEEEAFFRTLRRGGNLLNQVMERSSSHHKVISGEDAFKLKDTYGLPLEEITLLAHDAAMTVDLEKYKELDDEARERSRRVHKTTHQIAGENVFADFASEHASNEFVGYQKNSCDAKIQGILVNGEFVNAIEEGAEGSIILDTTPFYAEKGGQVGDTGTIESANALFEVTDCQTPYQGTITHIGKIKKGTLKVGDQVTGSVDTARRQRIANNHTATHLLHWALRKVLGEHVRQAGSVVEANRLRFDFSHHKGLSKEEIREIENLVNARIRENRPVDIYEIAYDEVQKRKDIIQFFDEKYGSRVRVIDIDFSKELCGGIHTSQLGSIGLFRVAKEGSIAAGVRRIEAVTGAEAEELVYHTEDRMEQVSELLKTQPLKLQEKVEKLLHDHDALSHQLKELQKSQMDSLLVDLMKKKEMINEVHALISEVLIGPKEIKEFAEKAMKSLSSGVVVLASKHDDKCQLLACVSDDLIKKGYHANVIIKELSPIIQGGGGGKSHFAQAGGTAPDKIAEAITKAKELIGRMPNS